MKIQITSLLVVLCAYQLAYCQTTTKTEDANKQNPRTLPLKTIPPPAFQESPQVAVTIAARYAARQKAMEDAAPFKAATQVKDLKEQYKAIDDLLLERNGQADVLMDQLASYNGREAFSAAFLLGEMRFKQALPALIRSIATKNAKIESPDMTTMPMWGEYPMAEAVAKFGRDATSQLVANLASNDDPKNREVSLAVVVNIEGLKFARLILSDALDNEKDPAKKARLQAAYDALKRYETATPKQ